VGSSGHFVTDFLVGRLVGFLESFLPALAFSLVLSEGLLASSWSLMVFSV
jgi:hypothetical protein